MHCINCGNEINDFDIFCPYCGQRINNEQATETKTDIPQPRKKKELKFMSLPISKLLLMSITTFGLYELFWSYKYWKSVQAFQRKRISPFWRALFNGITNFMLFPIIAQYIKKKSKKEPEHILLAIIYIAFASCASLDNPFWLLSFLTIIPLIIIQERINDINANYKTNAENNEWSVANGIWMLPGMILLFLAIIGTFLPDAE